MRIATIQSYTQGLNSILRAQDAVNTTQLQVSSGKRVLTPSDDPIASTKILQLEQDIAQRDRYDVNMTLAENRLSLEEATLSSVSDILIRVKELTVAAGAGSLTQEDRQAIAAEVEELEESLADLFNTQDPSGDFIFSGFKGKTEPFQKQDNGRYEYHGDEGQRYLDIANSVRIATGDTGKDLFVDVAAAKNTFTATINPLNNGSTQVNPGFVMDEEAYGEFYPDDLVLTFNPEFAISPPGPNYTIRRASDDRVVEGLANVAYVSGTDIRAAGTQFNVAGEPESGDEVMIQSTPKQSITDTLFRLREGLNTLQDNESDSETLEVLIEDTLVNLTNAQSSVSEVRSHLGARLNIIENTRDMSADMKLVSQEILSELEDIDFAEAVSRLSLQTFVLEAAQQSYTSISRLSLINQL